MNTAENFERDLRLALEPLINMLVLKNARYGNSALNPLRILSKADPEEQLKVRMDDKISRLVSKTLRDPEDSLTDLVGYYLLSLVYQLRKESAKWDQEKEEIKYCG